ncbi:MAG: hypothetical protein AAF600_08425 [Bacteroidota bacterium]
MAVTRLERKGRKNKNVAKNRVATIKRLNRVPSIKNVDIEEIKNEFASKNQKSAPKKEETEKPKANTLAETLAKTKEKKEEPKKEETLEPEAIATEEAKPEVEKKKDTPEEEKTEDEDK